MKRRFPLYAKILLWFFLNLLLLGIVGYFIFASQFGIDLLVSGPVITRISGVREVVTSELRAHPRAEWNAVLDKTSSAYDVKFLLFQDDGTQLAGDTTALPDDVKNSLRGPERRGPDRDHDHDRDHDRRRSGESRSRPERGDFNALRESSGPDSTNFNRPRFEPNRFP